MNPKEYKGAILESLKLMKDSWRIKNKKDFKLQRKFKKLYLKKTKEFNFVILHGKIKSTYSPYFLRRNRWFLKQFNVLSTEKILLRNNKYLLN